MLVLNIFDVADLFELTCNRTRLAGCSSKPSNARIQMRVLADTRYTVRHTDTGSVTAIRLVYMYQDPFVNSMKVSQ